MISQRYRDEPTPLTFIYYFIPEGSSHNYLAIKVLQKSNAILIGSPPFPVANLWLRTFTTEAQSARRTHRDFYCSITHSIQRGTFNPCQWIIVEESQTTAGIFQRPQKRQPVLSLLDGPLKEGREYPARVMPMLVPNLRLRARDEIPAHFKVK